MNHQEHFLKLYDLLKKERAEDRKQYENKIRNRSLEDRRKDGVTWYPAFVQKTYLSTGERWTVQLERTSDLHKRHMFQAGSSASVFLDSGKARTSAAGIVTRVSEKSMTIVLHRDELPDWLDDGRLGIDLLFDESTYDEMEAAMKRLAGTKEGRILDLIKIFLGKQEPRFSGGHGYKLPGLNDSQNAALSLIDSAQNIALVHGPPGTGKTTTLVEAIAMAVDMEKQVLVTTASNAAIDLLTERLTQKNVRVLRLGHPARVTDEVVNCTLDIRLANHDDSKMLKDLRKKSEEYRKMGLKYKRNFGHTERAQRKLLLTEARQLKDDAQALESHMVQDELNRAQVIACTLIGANSTILRNRQFKTVFIDEASQAMEPAAWIPLMRCARVVMAGDHHQLPPTIKSQEAAKAGLSTTLFDRAIEQWDADQMLKTQYRMHPEILQFSNDTFYNGALTTAESVMQRRSLASRPITYIDTAGCGYQEKVNPETLSTFNTEEGHFVIRHLSKILDNLPDSDRLSVSIGIIAPYQAQVEVLRKEVAGQGWHTDVLKHLTIASVDAFQGQERDIMIISLTRSNDRGEIGFLADKRRMNVAMTRAKSLMVIVGDSATLGSDPFFSSLIDHAQQHGWYHSAFEYLYE